MASRRTREPSIGKEHDPAHVWVEERLGALPNLSVRRLFGGAGVYSDETIFGILDGQRLYLKTDARTRIAFVERGSQALRTSSGVLTSYYEVPSEVLDDEEELARWARLALDVALAGLGRPRRRRG